MSRSVMKSYFDRPGSFLEIGPLIDPFLPKSTYDVYYADILDTDGVYNAYKDDSTLGTPEEIRQRIAEIDFALGDRTYMEAVGGMKFQAVFSSHVIEHIPDIIGHLREISDILDDEGLYALAIPDKRYTFDRFREVTPFRDALDVHLSSATNTARLVWDCLVNTLPHFKPVKLRLTDVSFQDAVRSDASYDNARKAYYSVKSGEALPNAHYWVFTFVSFLAFLRDAARCRLLPYSVEYADAPRHINCFEFHIALKKNIAMLHDEKIICAESAKLTEMIASYEAAYADNQYREFFRRHPTIYIYGAGELASECFHCLQSIGVEVTAFVVTDGQDKTEKLFGVPVRYLSEIRNAGKEAGVLLGLNEENREQVVGVLEEYGLDYV